DHAAGGAESSQSRLGVRVGVEQIKHGGELNIQQTGAEALRWQGSISRIRGYEASVPGEYSR
ncbi:MAG TPA: hypothetical protein VK530_11875, partial [Candidatus Acidoferrum sp.]|nr:hypothetical protein [Candidatus Acidoferrum sp.]